MQVARTELKADQAAEAAHRYPDSDAAEGVRESTGDPGAIHADSGGEDRLAADPDRNGELTCALSWGRADAN